MVGWSENRFRPLRHSNAAAIARPLLEPSSLCHGVPRLMPQEPDVGQRLDWRVFQMEGGIQASVRILMKEKIGHGAFDDRLTCFNRHAASPFRRERSFQATHIRELHS